MKSLFLTAPILPGKLEAWRRFGNALAGERRDAYRAAIAEGGLDRLRVWYQRAPDGSDTATALYEGPAPERFLAWMSKSDDAFAVWFRSQLAEVHGVGADAIPAPAELAVDERVG